MQHSINFPSIKSKLAFKLYSFARKPFLTGCKRHNPRRFEIYNFSIFLLLNIISILETYFNLSIFQPFTNPESDFRFVQFFLYTLYIIYGCLQIWEIQIHIHASVYTKVVLILPLTKPDFIFILLWELHLFMYSRLPINQKILHKYTYL